MEESANNSQPGSAPWNAIDGFVPRHLNNGKAPKQNGSNLSRMISSMPDSADIAETVAIPFSKDGHGDSENSDCEVCHCI